ncbi:hypothetical protein HPB47_006652 [Ixodes persulcatus]|uniref:Uncharacterized protein n=1 Tax=Ixodes persulcatus TaxID=34615 RepID=A0AC60PAL4_IXOPE|nr:hypothetical protein HPB47_006652 [Ixodes persulcatus]
MERGRRILGIMGKRASKLNKDEIRELEESTYCGLFYKGGPCAFLPEKYKEILHINERRPKRIAWLSSLTGIFWTSPLFFTADVETVLRVIS